MLKNIVEPSSLRVIWRQVRLCMVKWNEWQCFLYDLFYKKLLFYEFRTLNDFAKGPANVLWIILP